MNTKSFECHLVQVAWYCVLIHIPLLLFGMGKATADIVTPSVENSEMSQTSQAGGECPAVQADHEPTRKRCRIYMAPTSLKNMDGFGIYTTEALAAGDFFLTKADGPSITVPDYGYYPHDEDPLEAERAAFIRMFDSYWWGRGVPDHVTFEAEANIDFQITFGSLPNHHCILSTVDYDWPSPAYDDSLVARTEPGAGAFSYHMGRMMKTQRELEAGDEIFLNYGYCNSDDVDDVEDEGSNYPEWAAFIPQHAHFKTAAKITPFWWKRLQTLRDLKSISIDTVFEVLYESFAFFPRDKVTARTIELLPKSIQELNQIMEKRNGDGWQGLARTLAKHFGTTPRTVDWIVENGLCVENLVPGKSSIPQAGQGAIAQFPIKKGEIIVPAPMLHIMDPEVLSTYDADGEQMGYQLLLNYCFGHRDSSLLLCPDTNAILINHCSSRLKQCANGPNARVQWASGWQPNHKDWLKMSIKELLEQSSRGIAMEVVASRDIVPGEEVFIDYGKDWEDAWNLHTKRWSEYSMDSIPSVAQLNSDSGSIPAFLVSDDLRQDEDHPNVLIGCAYWSTDSDYESIYEVENPNWINMTDDELLKTYGGDGSEFIANYTTHKEGTYWPCHLLKEQKDGGYIVRIHQLLSQEQMPLDYNELPRFLVNYPRSGIYFFRQPYSGDQHLKHAFRHPIGIPDDIFPENWMNRKNE